ncbi:glycosyltransferase 87 family protein [Kitasatospora sp. NPDC057692]|uniref:glycosyltransferase 87 family protein n=1 Tax=Kitasatospora sp. NPDC057692 TaxID=3346215 RepID=UPI003676A423
MWCGGWLVAAGWAGAFPLTSGLGPHRSWGLLAAAGYVAAAIAVLALPPRWARAGSVAVALAGAVLAPLLVLVLTGQGQSEVVVIERSGELLLRHGTPYLAEPQTVAEYTPYLPGMALFGLPRALFGADGWPARLLGDARLWCAAVFLGCLAAAVRPRGRGPVPPTTGRATTSASASGGLTPGGGPTVPVPALPALAVAALVSSPLVALPLCVSGVDLPLTGLCVLALALAGRARPFAAGSALALACALKWTAWPTVAVAVALLAATAGRRAALRTAATAVAGTAALVLPSALRAPGPLVEQVFAFPTGRGGLPTPASSPLPGRLLADLAPGGWYAALALLLLAGLAVARSLVRHPPRDTVAAADRLALGLALAFLLAPAGRFGYLALPAVLALLPRLSGSPRIPRASLTSLDPLNPLDRPTPRRSPRPRTPQVVSLP